MKSIASVLSILALGFGLLGCSGGGGEGGGGVTFTITTTSAPFGTVGNAYSATLATTGGTAPLTWTLFGGTLPIGLSLNAGTGVVNGTPTADGNSTAVFTVRDSTGKTATGSVSFAIHPRTDRVSVNSSGTAGNGASSAPVISGDGSLVAFVSQSANFVTSVSGTQIYLHNRQTNQIDLVSRDNSVSVVIKGNGVSNAPTVSADGRFVAFVSQATNLLAPGTPAVAAGQQIYVRDLQTGLTSLVSVDNNVAPSAGNGFSSAPTISADGRFVAFVSQATNLLAPGTPAIPAGQQIYVRDRQTGQTSLVSVDNNVVPGAGNGFSSAPSINGDGRFVAFVSLATNLLAPGIPAVAGQQIYVRDRQVNQTSIASADNNVVPNPGNGVSSAPSINGDGSIVAFDSLGTNLLAPGVPSVTGRQVYVRNRTVSQTSLVSADNNVVPNQGNGVSRTPSISSDGRFVAFASLATNLLAPGIPAVAGQQVYSRDRQINQTNLVSQDNTNTDVPGNAASDTPSANSDGSFVAFYSQSANLVAGSVALSDIYIRALP